MSVSLSVLREQNEKRRFERLGHDDARTAIGSADAAALAAELKPKIAGEVRFDKGTRAIYSTDGSNYRQVPIGVVIPRDADDVKIAIELARKYGAPILSRGGGTSLAGQCCNVAVVMDFSKYMHRVLEVDAANRLATVEPGCVLDDLRSAARRQAALTFAPDPETHTHCTLGGMLGNNSCGVHSLMSKNNGMGLRTSDNTHSLEILTYTGHRLTVGATSPDELESIIRAGGARGEIYRQLKKLRDEYADEIRARFPKLGRRVSGYNLDELLPENGFHVARALVGTESTCVTFLQATLHLVPEPKARTLVVFGYKDIYSAADHLEQILEFNPTGLEGMDHYLFKFVKSKGDENANLALLPPGGGFLLVEFGGDSKRDADEQARACIAAVVAEKDPPSAKLYDDPEQEEMIWKVREGSLGSTAWVPGMPDTWEGWEDSAVPVHNVAPYLRDLRGLLDRYNYHPTLYGHLGQGCIHTRIPFDLYTAKGIQTYRSFIEEASDLVLKYGGSFSGEHGDGQSRGELLPKMFGPRLMQAFREFKAIWDPNAKMNPGKKIDAYRMDENLRLGPDYNPPQPKTWFQYPADRHSFARASLRCVGVGECRREGGGTMCPSYMVTREEMHSTRGRARILFEMMNGEVIDEGWASEEVKEALDLCLSCKGCKGDCPVNVDMATYKAEFLAHYYQGHLRPRTAYAFGWIHLWARLASYAPTLVNFITQTPLLSGIAKRIAGMTPQRQIPAFAPQTFQDWFASHPPKHPDGRPVVIFPDTFNNHFHPHVGIAAVESLEEIGFRVIVPQHDVCCGRPLYDYGFLNMARRWLLDVIEKLRPYIQQSVPIVVLEPSCWSVFRDELTNILPNNQDAQRLSELCFSFGDFLDREARDYQPPKLRRSMLLHGHCHQKALDRTNTSRFGELFYEKDLLKKMELEFRFPETGCCGMAGAFGFEGGDHYAVAVACGERKLLPEVRQAADETIICADGFSCREQIRQCTDREALHLAQVMQLALHPAPAGKRAEARLIESRTSAHRRAALRTAGWFAAGAALAAMWHRSRQEQHTAPLQ
jgi:FAD/FMN-containing dehydrogenase/Fe-S oxidoreductase